MKLTPPVKAIFMVIVAAVLLAAIWFKYDTFLSNGRKAPENALILNKIEKEGLPEFVATDLSGRQVLLSQFKGKAVILNFWASWCDPCVAEFPSLVKLISHFHGEVVLVAISADYEMQDLTTFLKAFKVQDPNIYIVWDKEYSIAKKFGTFRLPESYIINKEGKLLRKIAGVDDWSTPEAFQFFKSILSRK